ncbi:MAG: peptidase U32 family protein, partial [Clostridia bacterium]
MQTRSIELLAPAGDIDSFYSAVNNGANAVYLGLSGFNARLKADNFDGENLIKCVKYAHFFGVKVYVTVNTLVKNSEIVDLIALVEAAVDAHVDAFIVQDLGVAKILTECFPHIVLHASTQCGIHNADGAKIAEKLGFKRIVLSRETKLDDIKAIKATTDLELEFFVQGALCVSFSGNCYMSAVEASASGNRGLCKQLCRMQYDAVKETKDSQKLLKSGYLLSARDLCLIDSLKELLDAGISSFKIEGRMKRAGYVGEVVKIYRDAVDEIENQAGKTETHAVSIDKIAYETENQIDKTETQADKIEKQKEKIDREIDCKM